MTRPRLGVVSPMANEAATALDFVDAVLAECAECEVGSVDMFVVLDHASTDDTRSLLERHALRERRLHVVWAPENRGVADAYVRGYRVALEAGSDWILEIDAGFAHRPSDIGAAVALLGAGNDCVFGSRFCSGGTNKGSAQRRAVSRCGTFLANALLGTGLSDMTGGFELFTRAALEHVLERGIRSKGPFFQTEIKVHCRNLRIAELPIHYDASSHRVGRRALTEAAVNLGRLFGRRLVGAL